MGLFSLGMSGIPSVIMSEVALFNYASTHQIEIEM